LFTSCLVPNRTMLPFAPIVLPVLRRGRFSHLTRVDRVTPHQCVLWCVCCRFYLAVKVPSPLRGTYSGGTSPCRCSATFTAAHRLTDLPSPHIKTTRLFTRSQQTSTRISLVSVYSVVCPTSFDIKSRVSCLFRFTAISTVERYITRPAPPLSNPILTPEQ